MNFKVLESRTSFIQSSSAILNSTDFEDFYTLLRNALLEPGWDTHVCSQLHATKQNGQEFNDFYLDVLAQNALLEGTDLVLNMTEVLIVMEANLDEDLRKEALQPLILNIPRDDMVQWTTRMCELNATLRRQRENTQTMIAKQ